LSKWYAPYEDDEKLKLKGEVHRLVAPRDQKYQSNFVEVKEATDKQGHAWLERVFSFFILVLLFTTIINYPCLST